VTARNVEGQEASGVAKVPGGGVDLELGAGKKKPAAKRG
jgi:hypothetical protein